jgi:hypothetical protein
MTWREWERRNCRLTWVCFLMWVLPVGAIFLLPEGYQWLAVLPIALGVWRAKPGWRRWLVAAPWLIACVFSFWGEATVGLLLGWIASFYLTWWRDGQDAIQAPNREAWE